MKEPEIETLNSLLIGELSAVESYSSALDRVNDNHIASILEQCRRSHEERASKLRAAIVDSGGTPVTLGAGWSKMAEVLSKAASRIGDDNALLTALEEGEDVGLNDYEWKLVSMHGENRKLVKEELFPKQQATHKLLSKVLSARMEGTWPPSPEMIEG